MNNKLFLFDLLLEEGIKSKGKTTDPLGEHCSPCPWCGGKDRFLTWPRAGKYSTGIYFCCNERGRKGCGRKGDVLQYLMDRRGMTFSEARHIAGVEIVQAGLSQNPGQKNKNQKFIPRDFTTLPDETFQEEAKRIIEAGVFHLWNGQGEGALKHLWGRGLKEDTIRKAHLGYVPGMGILIPYLTAEGDRVKRIRLRHEDEYMQRELLPNRYTYYITNCWSQPMIWNNRHAITVVVESELCGWLLQQEASDLVNIIATGSTTIRPDKEADEMIRDSALTLISLGMNFWFLFF